MADEPEGTEDTVATVGELGELQTMVAPSLAEGTQRAGLEIAATVAAPSGGPLTTRPLGVHASSGATLAALDDRRYTFGALLGQGGMGEVVLAFDEHIGREVAVKRIRAEDPSSEELARFVREARVQGRLQHPAVVPVHDLAFDKDGKPYFVMKRLSGTTVAEVLRALRDGTEPDEATARRRLLHAFVDVCLAIEFAHREGVIHRDLKPANIMLGDFGEVYVLDWGVARAVTELDEGSAATTREPDLRLDSGETRAGTVLGTPAYMAPEQLAGERTGPAADIYSLGCILFEIAAGQALHDNRRSVTSLLTPVDARPSRVRPDSPPELDVICERATRLAPEERFGSARALGDAVQAFLDGDRDLAVRRELARHHLDAARAALVRSDGEASRREAMRAAGRALALDPTATDAADLVTRLMLEPPRDIPAEVERQLAAIDTETARTQGRLAAVAMAGYLAFVPLLLWTGVRDASVVVAFVALAVASCLQVWLLTRRDHIPRGGIYLNACVNAVLIGLVCRMVGPFIIAPTLVTTTLMAYAAHPAFGAIRIVSLILTAAVAVPWGLEAAGVLAPTYRFTDAGELVLSSPNLTFSAMPVQLAFAALLLALVAVVALLTRGMALRQRRATRTLELQAWHLRQIVPTRGTQPPPR